MKHLSRKQKAYIDEKTEDEKRRKRRRRYMVRGEVKGSNSYRYVGGYWEAREKGNWESCPDIFGQVSTDTDFNPTS